MVDLGLGRSQRDLDFVANQTAVGLQNHNNLLCIYIYIFFMLWAMGKCLLDTIYYSRQKNLEKLFLSLRNSE